MQMDEKYVIGVDFGTDSVRAVIVDAAEGTELGTEVVYYPRWTEGKYCNPEKKQFRQHPLDYLESLEKCLCGVLAKPSANISQKIQGISIDTTGSTPCAVNTQGQPLALMPEFAENPNAMFVLWKDHTAVNEAMQITNLAKEWGGHDYTMYEGGIYSAEWFWSKILHIIRNDRQVKESAFSWVEHCDWIPAVLTGNTDPQFIKRSRTAAGHKAMWHRTWNGLPSKKFLSELDPYLADLRDNLYQDTYTADTPAGNLSEDWANKLGLSTDCIIGVGAFDAHLGAVGAEIEPNMLVKVMGTSTCDMVIVDNSEEEKLVNGICGQVDGSIMPNMLGLEAGQSAFGDIYAWFSDLLMWPLKSVVEELGLFNQEEIQDLQQKVSDQIIPLLSDRAEQLAIEEDGLLAIDWLNGRRTPDANQELEGAITGLNLGSDAPRIFRALVESTAFGAKKIVERFNEEGVEIEGVIAIGGIPKKSPFVMQVTADVLNMPIKVVAGEESVALGTAMAAAAASGIYSSIEEAQQAMGKGFEKTFLPSVENVEKYKKLYEKYSKLCDFIEFELSEKP